MVRLAVLCGVLIRSIFDQLHMIISKPMITNVCVYVIISKTKAFLCTCPMPAWGPAYAISGPLEAMLEQYWATPTDAIPKVVLGCIHWLTPRCQLGANKGPFWDQIKAS